MRNTYKYTKLYSGGIPEFIEGDVFRTIIPLNEVATGKVGPKIVVSVQDTPQATPHVKILTFCQIERSKSEIMEHCGYKDSKSFTKKYLKPLLDNGQLRMTIPDKPKSSNQKYIAEKQE